MDLADPQQWNAYTYSRNNPVTFSDPSGLRDCADLDCNQFATPSPTGGAKKISGRPLDVTAPCAPNCKPAAPGDRGPTGPVGTKNGPTMVATLVGSTAFQQTYRFIGKALIQTCLIGNIPIACNGPQRYMDAIVKYSTQAGIDPRLLLSILLQEHKAINGHGLIEEWSIWLGVDSSRGIGNMTKETFEHIKQWRNFENRDWEDLSSDPYLAIEAAAYHLLDLKAAAADHYAGTAATMRREELIGAGYRSGFTAVWNLSRGRESAVTRAEMRQ